MELVAVAVLAVVLVGVQVYERRQMQQDQHHIITIVMAATREANRALTRELSEMHRDSLSLLKDTLYPPLPEAPPAPDLPADVLAAARRVVASRAPHGLPVDPAGLARQVAEQGSWYLEREEAHEPEFIDPINLDGPLDRLPDDVAAEIYVDPAPEAEFDRDRVASIAPGENPFKGLQGLDPDLET